MSTLSRRIADHITCERFAAVMRDLGEPHVNAVELNWTGSWTVELSPSACETIAHRLGINLNEIEVPT